MSLEGAIAAQNLAGSFCGLCRGAPVCPGFPRLRPGLQADTPRLSPAFPGFPPAYRPTHPGLPRFALAFAGFPRLSPGLQGPQTQTRSRVLLQLLLKAPSRASWGSISSFFGVCGLERHFLDKICHLTPKKARKRVFRTKNGKSIFSRTATSRNERTQNFAKYKWPFCGRAQDLQN